MQIKCNKSPWCAKAPQAALYPSYSSITTFHYFNHLKLATTCSFVSGHINNGNGDIRVGDSTGYTEEECATWVKNDQPTATGVNYIPCCVPAYGCYASFGQQITSEDNVRRACVFGGTFSSILISYFSISY